MDDVDRLIREILVAEAVGGAEGASRLIDAATARDYEAAAEILAGVDRHILVDLVCHTFSRVYAVTQQASDETRRMMIDALADIRDHGGNLDDVLTHFGRGTG